MIDPKETLKDSLYQSIINYGTTDKRTVKLSQALDIQIVAEQRLLMSARY